MKTDDLVAMLATGPTAAPRRAAVRRLELALLAAVPLSFLIMWLGYGVRPDLLQAMFWPMFWAKLLFPVCVAVAAFVMAQRLARPGVRVRGSWLGIAAPIGLIWAMAAIAWFGTPAGERMPLLMGQTWRMCMVSIGLISLPVFAAALLTLKTLAPTRPALAGAAAGALAGGVGAAVYALHCIELTAPFLAVWYVGGIALPAAVGALIGPRLLRW